MDRTFEVIIVGGSYAGLSAALALGRSLRKVLVIDAGKPCNTPTPHSHNFLTHDGSTPSEIATLAKAQVEKYETVSFYDDFAVEGTKTADGFSISTQDGSTFEAKKIIFATGLMDIMPDIEGFAECWGKTILHCPYCHGFEVRHQKTGIISNGEDASHYVPLISNWTKDLTLFTNGASTLSKDQTHKFLDHDISIIETPIKKLNQGNGQIQGIVLGDNRVIEVQAIYSKPPFVQHSSIPQRLGCEINEQELITVDAFQKTSVPGVYACGDNSNFRSVSLAVSSGSVAGVMANKDLIDEVFE